MNQELFPIWLYFENGTFIKAKALSQVEKKVGEVVFNTSMSGYQEIVTDPSYAGQFVVFTMPEIGIVGTNDDDMESDKVHACGMIIRNLSHTTSNFRAQKSLQKFMTQHNSTVICDIDTRYLTKMLRDEGSMMMIASTTINDKKELKKILENSPRIEDINYAKQVSTKNSYKHKKGAWSTNTQTYNSKTIKNPKKVIVIDFGVKRAILNSLYEVGIEPKVVNSNFEPQEIITKYKEGKIHGVFLSNGPGEPLKLENETNKIKDLIDANIPMFGICLGHQLLSIAHGYPTYKLKFGQHGANHPVLDTQTKKIEITAQNHNYNVPKNIEEIAYVTHYNLFDDTIEGVAYKNKPIFSVQHHPEASPGPHESKVIFQKFYDIL